MSAAGILIRILPALALALPFCGLAHGRRSFGGTDIQTRHLNGAGWCSGRPASGTHSLRVSECIVDATVNVSAGLLEVETDGGAGAGSMAIISRDESMSPFPLFLVEGAELKLAFVVLFRGGVNVINQGTLTIKEGSHVMIRASNAEDGAAIRLGNSNLIISGKGTYLELEGNTARHWGGAIHAFSYSEIVVDHGARCSVRNNRAAQNGGGVHLRRVR